MADVKWIKVYTDMVSNKKIKRIRTLPEGNNTVLIWVFLLAQAGESNKSGALYLTDTLPFRAEDLAVEFDFEVPVINLALVTLERFSMIEVFDEVIYIKNWGEYQNIDGLEKIKEQTRNRVSSYREKQKQLTECNVTCNATVTLGNATELELELDKEVELDIDVDKDTKKGMTKKTKPKASKILFGEKVHLSEKEYQTLIEKNGEQDTDQMISILDNWYLLHGKKPYASDYQTMVTNGWVFNKLKEIQQKQGGRSFNQKQPNRPKGFDAIDQWYDMTKGMLDE